MTTLRPPLVRLIPCAAVLVLAACSRAESHGASTPADARIGVLQCDEYLAWVDACIRERVPAGERAVLAAEAHRTFTTWKEATADAVHRSTLPQACAVTHELAREEFARYGCSR